MVNIKFGERRKETLIKRRKICTKHVKLLRWINSVVISQKSRNSFMFSISSRTIFVEVPQLKLMLPLSLLSANVACLVYIHHTKLVTIDYMDCFILSYQLLQTSTPFTINFFWFFFETNKSCNQKKLLKGKYCGETYKLKIVKFKTFWLWECFVKLNSQCNCVKLVGIFDFWNIWKAIRCILLFPIC